MRLSWLLVGKLAKRFKITNCRRWFLMFNTTVSGLSGLILWLAIMPYAFNTIDWLICFIGYPAMFYGYIGGLIYMLNVDDRSEE